MRLFKKAKIIFISTFILLGFIQKEVFIDIFINLTNSSLGTDYLPDAWMNLTFTDVS